MSPAQQHRSNDAVRQGQATAIGVQRCWHAGRAGARGGGPGHAGRAGARGGGPGHAGRAGARGGGPGHAGVGRGTRGWAGARGLGRGARAGSGRAGWVGARGGWAGAGGSGLRAWSKIAIYGWGFTRAQADPPGPHLTAEVAWASQEANAPADMHGREHDRQRRERAAGQDAGGSRGDGERAKQVEQRRREAGQQ